MAPLIKNAMPTYFGGILKSDYVIDPIDNELIAVRFAGVDVTYPSARTIYPINNNLNEEAVAVVESEHRSYVSGTIQFDMLTAHRGVLNTRQVPQSRGTLLYYNRKAMGSTCRIYTCDKDAQSRLNWNLVYHGVVDDIGFGNNNGMINVNISHPIVELYRNKVSARFSDSIETFIPRTETGLSQNVVTPYPGEYTDNYNVTAYQVGVRQTDKFNRWKWMKVGKAAIRLMSDDEPLYTNLSSSYASGTIATPDQDIIFQYVGVTGEFYDLETSPQLFDEPSFTMCYSVPRFVNTPLENISNAASFATGSIQYFVNDNNIIIGGEYPSPGLVVVDPFD